MRTEVVYRIILQIFFFLLFRNKLKLTGIHLREGYMSISAKLLWVVYRLSKG